MWKIIMGIPIKSSHLETPWVRKNAFYESVGLRTVFDRMYILRFHFINPIEKQKFFF